MPTRRIFIGGFVHSEQFLRQYTEVQKHFALMTSGRWVELSNLHFTMKFIGDVEEEKIPDIIDALNHPLATHIDEIFFSGLGCFPDCNNPKIFYAAIKNPSGVLAELNEEIESKLEKLGYPREEKKFIPHITLQRIKDKHAKNFAEEVRKFSFADFGYEALYTIQIIESFMMAGGSQYKPYKLITAEDRRKERLRHFWE